MTGTAITTLTDLLRMKPTSASIRIDQNIMFHVHDGWWLGSWEVLGHLWVGHRIFGCGYIYLFGGYKFVLTSRKKLVGDAESGLLACVNNNYLLIKSAEIACTVIADA